jgi:hypothetical protein
MAFLTILGSRQALATHGNGFRLFSRFRRSADLPLIATDCPCWAPQTLHPFGRGQSSSVAYCGKSLDPSISLSARETWDCSRKVRTGGRRSIRGFTHRGIEFRL